MCCRESCISKRNGKRAKLCGVGVRFSKEVRALERVKVVIFTLLLLRIIMIQVYYGCVTVATNDFCFEMKEKIILIIVIRTIV